MIRIITHHTHLPGETDIWLQLLNAGADSILLRKPGWQEAEYEALLCQADPACYSKLLIATHATLCERYHLRGLHFRESARNMLSQEQLSSYTSKGWQLSTSVHSVQTLQLLGNDWSQVLLAPVFDSISKQHHRAAFGGNFRLEKGGYNGLVLALGGVDHITAGTARNMQFDGIALLGAIWMQPEQALKNFCQIRDSWK